MAYRRLAVLLAAIAAVMAFLFFQNPPGQSELQKLQHAARTPEAQEVLCYQKTNDSFSCTLTFKGEMFNLQGYSVVSDTGSMFPCMFGGSYGIGKKVSGGDVEIGDIVVIQNIPNRIYSSNLGYVNELVHRVVWANETCFITKGDSMPSQDGVCWPKDGEYGKVVGILP